MVIGGSSSNTPLVRCFTHVQLRVYELDYEWVKQLNERAVTDYVSIMTQFLQYVETRFGWKVKDIRLDNALDLTEGDMKISFHSKGIV